MSEVSEVRWAAQKPSYNIEVSEQNHSFATILKIEEASGGTCRGVRVEPKGYWTT